MAGNRNGHAQRNAILRGCYRRGWDAALTGDHRNPYTRSDNASWWQDAHDRCLRNEAPPAWLVKPQWAIDAEQAAHSRSLA